jgi:DNA-binding beta-propeller fold protein YncE
MTILNALLFSLLISGDPLITTGAGTGERGCGGDGGPATQARLNQPFDVAFDSGGDVYFSDTFNHRICRIDRRTGEIRTVAGMGTAGFSGDGGPATAARINEPYGVVLDGRGSLYFADRLNRRVRRVDAGTGRISTVAGTGQAASTGDGGSAQHAALVEPNGVALDPAGKYLYIADVAAHRIRKVDLVTARISTFAGTGRPRHDGDAGPATHASIWGARAVDVRADGTVFILEREGNTLRAVDPATGIIVTVAGTGAKGFTGDDGLALKATFNGPKELSVDRRGNLWIVDTENHAIRVIDATSQIVRKVAGTGQPGSDGDGGPANRARLDRPHGIAVSLDGLIWIGDTNNNRLRVVAPKP